MPPLDPRLDFQDDGGTPAWRARVVDVSPPAPRAVAWFRRQPLVKLLLWAAALGFGLPWAVLLGGLLLAYSLTR